jgi:small subunit ribosomal protein S17
MNTQTSATPAAEPAKKAGLTRTLVGRVVSDKMNKTVTVLVERRVKHPTIGKFMTRSQKFHAHSEANEYKLGDLVEIEETRPISKTKAWKVSRLLEKSRLI